MSSISSMSSDSAVVTNIGNRETVVTVKEDGESYTHRFIDQFDAQNILYAKIGDLTSQLIKLMNSKCQEADLSKIREKISYYQKIKASTCSAKSFIEETRRQMFSNIISKMEQAAEKEPSLS